MNRKISVARAGRMIGLGLLGIALAAAGPMLVSTPAAGEVASGGAASGAVASAQAAPAETQPDIPVDLDTAVDGGYLPIVEVSINGSTPVKMMIDEGTSFLVTFPGSIIDPTTPIDETGIPQSIQYDGTAASGQIALATVTVTTSTGTVSTPEQAAFLDADSCTPHCLGYKDGVQGVIGIAQSKNATKNIEPPDGLYSVLAQLGPDYSSGYTIDFTSASPHIRLGRPAPGSGGDTTIQREDQDGLHYPNGQRIFKPPVICWTISLGANAGTSCKNTVLDTGQSTGKINGDMFDSVVTPTTPPATSKAIATVSADAVISFATHAGGPPFARLPSTGHVPHQYDQFPVERSATADYFNAGNDFYLSHVIGFDNENGAVVIHAATGAASPPSAVTATAGDRTIAVAWTPPSASGDDRPTGFVVTLRTVGGDLVSTTVVGAVEADAQLTGLTNGTPYLVAVASVNDLTIGADATASGPVTPGSAASPDHSATQLAESGSSAPTAAVLLAAALLLTGVVVLMLARRRSRHSQAADRAVAGGPGDGVAPGHGASRYR
jgi:hypothetical protein